MMTSIQITLNTKKSFNNAGGIGQEYVLKSLAASVATSVVKVSMDQHTYI